MPDYIKAIVLITVALVVAASTALSPRRGDETIAKAAQGGKAAKEQQSEAETHYPTVDYDSPELTDPAQQTKRKIKNARYDKKHFVKEDNPSSDVRKSVYYSDWDLG